MESKTPRRKKSIFFIFLSFGLALGLVAAPTFTYAETPASGKKSKAKKGVKKKSSKKNEKPGDTPADSQGPEGKDVDSEAKKEEAKAGDVTNPSEGQGSEGTPEPEPEVEETEVDLEDIVILKMDPKGPKIDGLVFETLFFPSSLKTTKKRKTEYWAKLKGSYPKMGWELLINSEKVTLDKQGQFEYKVLLTEKVTPITFLSVSPKGSTEKQESELQFPKWKSSEEPTSTAGKRSSFNFGITLSQVIYKETGIPDSSQMGFVIKPGWNYSITQRISAGFVTYFTLFPIYSTASQSMRFLGINIRANYTTPWLKPPWQLILSGGWYYTTTFVGNDEYGFKNVAGPMVYPVIKRDLGQGRSWLAYMKLAPVFDYSGFASAYEFASGGAYSWPILNKKFNLSITLDIAHLTLRFTESVYAQSTSISLGSSISW